MKKMILGIAWIWGTIFLTYALHPLFKGFALNSLGFTTQHANGYALIMNGMVWVVSYFIVKRIDQNS